MRVVTLIVAHQARRWGPPVLVRGSRFAYCFCICRVYYFSAIEDVDKRRVDVGGLVPINIAELL